MRINPEDADPELIWTALIAKYVSVISSSIKQYEGDTQLNSAHFHLITI